MACMTGKEYDPLDGKWTKNPPRPGVNGTGFFAQRRAALAARFARSITVDDLSANWLMTKALASHKLPADIIAEMIQKEIAAAEVDAAATAQ